MTTKLCIGCRWTACVWVWVAKWWPLCYITLWENIIVILAITSAPGTWPTLIMGMVNMDLTFTIYQHQQGIKSGHLVYKYLIISTVYITAWSYIVYSIVLSKYSNHWLLLCHSASVVTDLLQYSSHLSLSCHSMVTIGQCISTVGNQMVTALLQYGNYSSLPW